MTEALSAAFRDLFRPRMLGLVLWPLLGALLLWGLIALFAWKDLVEGLRGLLGIAIDSGWLSASIAQLLSQWIVIVALLVAIPPLTLSTALFITSLVAMPVMVREVSARDYPGLTQRHGGTVLGSLLNALGATLVYLAAWILTLPLWLFGLPALLLPLLLNGWLNARLFRYDALAEHADADEYRRLIAREGGPLLAIGLLSALVQGIPLLNLLSPVFTGLAYIHYCLARLQGLRAADSPPRPPRA